MSTGAIYLGDMLRALVELEITDDTEEKRIAELLGLDTTSLQGASEERPRRAEAEASTSVEPASAEVESPARPVSTEFEPETGGVETQAKEGEDRVTDGELEIETFSVPLETRPAWLDQEPKPEPELPRALSLPMQPLLSPPEAAGILREMIAISRDGPIDLKAAVKLMAQARPVTGLPRLARARLASSFELLLDLGPGLEPFSQDRRSLLAILRQIIGRDRTSTWYFSDCPDLGVRRMPESRPMRYPTPKSTKPIVIVTDLGIGRPLLIQRRSTVARWHRFAEKLVRSGHSVTCLVPYPSSRWPRSLARTMSIVPWDRPTSVSTVRRFRLRRR